MEENQSSSSSTLDSVRQDLEKSCSVSEASMFDHFADQTILNYLKGSENGAATIIESICGEAVDMKQFQQNFFGNDADVNVQSRSAALEWIRVVHTALAKLATRAFEGMEGLTNVLLDKADANRSISKHGRFYWTAMVVAENLKMMLSITNPNVVYSCYSFKMTPRTENHLKLHFYDVDPQTQEICYELCTQLLGIFKMIQFPSDPPACIAKELEAEQLSEEQAEEKQQVLDAIAEAEEEMKEEMSAMERSQTM